MQVLRVNNKDILCIEYNERFSFTISRGPNESISYTRDAEDLTESETLLLIAEWVKNNPEYNFSREGKGTYVLMGLGEIKKI